jgi:hypothetical protein
MSCAPHPGGKTRPGSRANPRVAQAPARATFEQMSEPITPGQLSAELGASDRAIRQWLRDQGWQSARYARWELNPDQAAQVPPTSAADSASRRLVVDKRTAKSRGLRSRSQRGQPLQFGQVPGKGASSTIGERNPCPRPTNLGSALG